MIEIDVSSLDEEIRGLDPWIHRAAESLLTFYIEDRGVFWRDNLAPAEEQSSKATKFSPTSTHRCFFAIREYLRFLAEENLDDDPKSIQFSGVFREVSEQFLNLLAEPKTVTLVRGSATNSVNMFTDSHLLVAVACLRRLWEPLKCKVDIVEIERACKPIAAFNNRLLERYAGGRANEVDETHDFVTLHTVRGLDTFLDRDSSNPKLKALLQQRIKERVLQLLAYDYSMITSKFDASELAFSLELMLRFAPEDVDQLAGRAIDSIANCQGKHGGWPAARLVSYQRRALLHIASFEVALSLSHTLIKTIRREDMSVCGTLLGCLRRSYELVKSSYDERRNFKGWANDHARTDSLSESWTTAVVLTFLIHYRDALIQLRQAWVLQNVYGVKPLYSRRSWPEMEPAFRTAQSIEKLHAATDPTDQEELSKILDTVFLEPIRNDWSHRPRQAASAIFFGKPGTGKTSLAKSLAKVLNWPLLILSPPDFLKNGLEGFESRTAEIFDDLLRLRRVIVLFDECEDFFKRRDPNQRLESRTAGAFITAGMLPRLQALRDSSWVLFILATNSQLDELDPAVTRFGRFDYVQEIEFPKLSAQTRFVTLLGGTEPKLERYATRSLTKSARKNQSNPVSFALLNRFVTQLRRNLPGMRQPESDRILQDLLSGPQHLLPRK